MIVSSTVEADLRLFVEAALPTDRATVVVLDEMPYLIATDPGFEGTLQKLFDRELSRRPVLLICIGSDLAMMEALNTYGRPFHQRVTEMVVPPLSPADVLEMLALPPADAFDAFLVSGGLPLILDEWPAGATVPLGRPGMPLPIRTSGSGFPLSARICLRSNAAAVTSPWRGSGAPGRRGGAGPIESVVRESLRRLPGDQLPADTNVIGGYWTRTNNPEVDIIGADREPVAKTVTMVGSVKWQERRPFDDHDLALLMLHRSQVPGADDTTPLVAVSRSGASTTGLLVLGPDELLTAYR